VTREWRRLHQGELHGLYSSPIVVRSIELRRMRWAGRMTHVAERKGAYSRRWEGNIKMVKKWDCGLDWTELAQEGTDGWRLCRLH